MVCIYIFPADDPRSIQQRLQHAVSGFCSANHLPIPQPEVLITARTEQGKPYFPHCPQLHFSISHSGKYWGCAVAEQCIGFDLQEKELPKYETLDDMLKRHQKMAERFFHPLEAEFVSWDCCHNFLTVWTAREAYVKHTGQGIDQYFSEHCVIPEKPDDQRRISGNTAAIRWSAMGKNFGKTYLGEGYTMCICTDMPCDWSVQSLI